MTVAGKRDSAARCAWFTFAALVTIMSFSVSRADATVFTGTMTMAGNVNSQNVSATGTTTSNDATGFASGNITIPAMGLWSIEINSLISWKCRATGKDSAGAVNLLGLTGGNFKLTSVYTFDTGQQLTIAYTVKKTGLTTFTCAETLSGAAPTFLSTDVVTLHNYDEIWTQESPGRISMTSARMVRVNGNVRKVSVTSSLAYTGANMPTSMQVISVRNVNNSYNSGTSTLHFDSVSNVAPGSVVPGASELALLVMALAMLGFGTYWIFGRRTAAPRIA